MGKKYCYEIQKSLMFDFIRNDILMSFEMNQFLFNIRFYRAGGFIRCSIFMSLE